MNTRRLVVAMLFAALIGMIALQRAPRSEAEAWTEIHPGESIWYEMIYQIPGEQATVRANYTPKPGVGGLEVGIYTPFNYAQWSKGQAVEPIGRGLPNEVEQVDRLWSGNFQETGTYYIHVFNSDAVPLYYDIQVSGKAVGPIRRMSPDQPMPAAPVPATQAPAPTATPTAAPPLPTATLMMPTMTATAMPASPTAAPSSPTATQPPASPSATGVPPTTVPATATPGTVVSARGAVLFTSNRESYDDCYTMNADGSNVRRLTTFGFCYNAHFSPDGSQIAFSHSVNEDSLSDIWVMNADGSNPRNLTNTGDNLESYPVWSPDGTKIAYLFGWAGGFEIYVMNADGTARRPLTARQFDLAPAWSPDGSRIAFTRLRPGGVEVFTVPAAGGATTQLTTNSGRFFVNPVWSPDGRQLAVTGFDGQNQSVYTMNADGTNVRVAIASVGTDRSNPAYVAAWRGSQFLIGGYRGNWDVYLADATTGTLTAITNHQKDDKPSDWRP